MAFEATTPFAIACLTDKAKSEASLKILASDAPIEGRTKDLFMLARSWSVALSSQEAYQIVTEYDRVVKASGGHLPPMAYS